MNEFYKALQGFLKREGDKKISAFEGTLTKWGKSEAIRVWMTQGGTFMASGNVRCAVPLGDGKEDVYIASFVAFGEQAEALAKFKEGDRVQLITDRRRRKWNDTWQEQNVVRWVGAVEAEGEDLLVEDDVPF